MPSFGLAYPTQKSEPLEQAEQPQSSNQKPASKFSFTIFGATCFSLLGSIGLLNWAVDPLWYHQGNQLTKKNFAFNERISKTNQFLKNGPATYDCVILGSSRVVALNADQFEAHNCYNYSFKGGWAEDFIRAAEFIKEQGLEPEVIYVGVDEFNFVKFTDNTTNDQDFGENATKSPFHAYFSSNVLTFSLLTLLGMSPDSANYYDTDFETQEFADAPKFNPEFYPIASPQECDLTKVERYRAIQDVFPDSTIIGFVPPRAAWSVVNETYNRGILDCALEGFYRVSQIYDGMYDFSVPSEMTLNPENTYDGSHFTPASNDIVADVLEGQSSEASLDLTELTFSEYLEAYKTELKQFLDAEGATEFWQG